MMDDFTREYVAYALELSEDDNDDALSKNHTYDEIDAESLHQMQADCKKFQEANAAMIGDRHKTAGQDFWLTRNGHGAGFWDGDWPEHGDALTDAAAAFGECYIYVGDDGKIYLG